MQSQDDSMESSPPKILRKTEKNEEQKLNQNQHEISRTEGRKMKNVNPIFYEIANIAFATLEQKKIFKCVSSWCNYRSNEIDRFAKHLNEYHVDGDKVKKLEPHSFCMTCNSTTDAASLNEELNHLIKSHLEPDGKLEMDLKNNEGNVFQGDSVNNQRINLQNRFPSSMIFNTPPYGDDERKSSVFDFEAGLKQLFGEIEPEVERGYIELFQNKNECDNIAKVRDNAEKKSSDIKVLKLDVEVPCTSASLQTSPPEEDRFLEDIDDQKGNMKNSEPRDETTSDKSVNENHRSIKISNQLVLNEPQPNVTNKPQAKRVTSPNTSPMAPKKFKPLLSIANRHQQSDVDGLTRTQKSSIEESSASRPLVSSSKENKKQMETNANPHESTLTVLQPNQDSKNAQLNVLLPAQLMPWMPVKCIRRNRKFEICYLKMMEKNSLAALFKCMDLRCSFTANSGEIFCNHLIRHPTCIENNPKKRDNFQLYCAYCLYKATTGRDLAHHVLDVHSKDVFQCTHCFYRSREKETCYQHILKTHPDEAINIYKCLGPKITAEIMETVKEKAIERLKLKRKIFVEPLKCQRECRN